ncbi:unnamed protein product, partial [marine sediment metagenome]
MFLTDKEGNLIAFPNKDRHLYKLKPDSLRKKILTGDSGMTAYQAKEGVSKICYYCLLKGYKKYKGQGWR